MKTIGLLAGMVFVAVLMQAFGRDPSLIHGIGVPEVFLGAVVGLLALEIALGNGPAFEERPLTIAFVLWCAWGLLSWAIVSVAGDYPTYSPLRSGMKLKANLFDYALVYVAFFFGARQTVEARFVLKALLAGVFVATLMHVLDSTGIVGMGLTYASAGRVQGIIGEANQTGVFVATFIPVFVGMAFSTRGLERMFWLSGVPVLLTELLVTASRGSVVGLIGAALLGLVVFRRYASVGRVVAFAVGGFVLLASIFAVLGVEDRGVIIGRFIGESTATGAADLSSGRTEFWASTLSRMMASPWSFLTGMGWDVYESMGFQRAPHNTYLGLLFNQGTVGLGCVLFILARTVLMARDACASADSADRRLLIGAAIGVVAAALSAFFVDVMIPWIYIWALVALTARLSVNIRAHEPVPVPAPVSIEGPARSGPAPVLEADPWGWRARSTERGPMGARRA